jgi:2Fe-2S ferredoxin
LGKNPFLRSAAPPPPRRAYTLTLKNTGQTFAVDPDALPAEEGQTGSVLATLLAHDVEIDHTCGGVLACSTCHIYVRQGGRSAPPPTEEEEDQLDFAPALDASSRLACQCVPDGSEDVVVELPQWKRNLVSEGH